MSLMLKLYVQEQRHKSFMFEYLNAYASHIPVDYVIWVQCCYFASFLVSY